MRTYTVNQLAKLAGISIRTLHHYDDIGLLSPALVGANRYRYYGRNELLRLQQILILRELDMPLQSIGALLDQPDFDRLDALLDQRERLLARAERYRRLVATIDRTIAALKGESEMNDDALYSSVVSPEKQAEYEAWLEQTRGPSVRAGIEAGRRAWAGLNEADRDRHMAELATIEGALADAMRDGADPASPAMDALIRRHHAWVAFSWRRPPTPGAYAGLADLYLSHPDFVARYERIAPGFTEFLVQAMKAWAERQPAAPA